MPHRAALVINLNARRSDPKKKKKKEVITFLHTQQNAKMKIAFCSVYIIKQKQILVAQIDRRRHPLMHSTGRMFFFFYKSHRSGQHAVQRGLAAWAKLRR